MRLRGMSTDATSPSLLRHRHRLRHRPSALPDDPAVLKQMIAELLRACAASAATAKACSSGSMPCCGVTTSPKPAIPDQPLLVSAAGRQLPSRRRPPPARRDDEPARQEASRMAGAGRHASCVTNRAATN